MAISTIKAIINGQIYDLTYNSSTGKYEKTITAPSTTSWNVNPGHYYPVQIQATDEAGNTTTKDDSDSILGANLKLRVKETTKPTVTINSPSSGAKLTTSSPTIMFQLRDSGSGIDIGTLALKIDGGTAIGNTATGMTCTAVSGGYDVIYACQSALAEGSHTITINVSDNDGNAATATSTTFTVDTVPPTLNITNPADGLITNNASLTVSGTTNDATSSPVTVTIKLNGTDQGSVSVSSGSFSKSITLAQGSNTIVVRSTDSAGKYSEITRMVTLDTTPPTISAVTVTPNPVNAGATYTISVTVSD